MSSLRSPDSGSAPCGYVASGSRQFAAPERSRSDRCNRRRTDLWRDRREYAVLIGRTEEGILRAVTVGGSESEFPCTSRGVPAVLVLGDG